MSVWGWLIFTVLAPFVIRWSWRLGVEVTLEAHRQAARGGPPRRS